MLVQGTHLGRTAIALTAGAALVLSSCGGETSQTNSNAPATQVAAGANAAVPTVLAATDATWTPEEMEDLLAPVALYPDPILGNVLVASTNPQEVLDAGNWRLENESLEGTALDDAAKKVGFTPPVRVLVQNPVILDMMNSERGWTTELGQAYVNDQAGVLDSVQRLRLQARDAGNLVSSDKLMVETEDQGGTQYVYLSSPDPEVVYVPQYDPEVVYAPVEQDKGHSTGTVVAAAALAFGAGLIVSNLFHDDDDDWYDDDYYYPRYYGEPMPYYSHYPYNPVYGGGYRASTRYVRPNNYRYAYNSSTVVVRRGNDNYWDRYDDRIFTKNEGRNHRSPITRVRPNRPELARINDEARKGPRRRPSEGSYGKGRDKVAGSKRRDGERGHNGRGPDGDRRGDDVDRDRGGSRDGDRGDRVGGDRGKARGGGGGGDGKGRGGGGGGKAKSGGGGGGKAKGGGGGGRGRGRG